MVLETCVVRWQQVSTVLAAGGKRIMLTLAANSVNPDQLASQEANSSGSALFVIRYVNFYPKPGSSNLMLEISSGRGILIYLARQGLIFLLFLHGYSHFSSFISLFSSSPSVQFLWESDETK